MLRMRPLQLGRARVMPSSKDPNMLRVVIIFDTTVEERPAGEDRYHALSPQDVGAHGHFMLAHHVRDNSWFLNEAWVDQWLLELYTARNQGKRRGAAWGEEDPYVLKHLASYLTWLDIVRLAVKDVAVPGHQSCPGHAGGRGPDPGHRQFPHHGHPGGDTAPVQHRPQPELCAAPARFEPARSGIRRSVRDPGGIVDATFGNDTLSRRSGRQTPAFAWPSAVRIGPEAARLATQAVCAEGTTGMSSPKRYLWDERPWAADLALQHQRQHRAHGQPRPVRPPAQSAGHAALLL